MEWRKEWKLWFLYRHIVQITFILNKWSVKCWVHFFIFRWFSNRCLYLSLFYLHSVFLLTTCTLFSISAFARRLQLGENFLLQNVTTSPKTKMPETTVLPEIDSDIGEERRNSAMDTSNSGRSYFSLLQCIVSHFLFASCTIEYSRQDHHYY